MTEESAEYACGQILFNLKSSNLHYLVKETHLSAYVTIRKKFIKPQTVNIRNDKIEVIKDVNSFDDRIRLENGLLKQEINELKTKCANWEVEYEEMEIRNKTFQETIDSLEDKLELQYTESCKLKKVVDENSNEHDKMEYSLKVKEEAIDQLQKAFDKAKLVNGKLELVNKQFEEEIILLESMNENLRIKSCEKCDVKAKQDGNLSTHVENEHSEEDIPSTSKSDLSLFICGTCDYNSDNKSDLDMHMKTHMMHLCELCSFKTELQSDLTRHKSSEHFRCQECLETFITNEKLKKHICKHEIGNPSFEHYYSRSWMDGNNCNKIYCNNIQQEVAILHCENCLKGEKTCCWSPYRLNGQSDGVTHLEFDKYTKDYIFKKMEIKWPELVISLK